VKNKQCVRGLTCEVSEADGVSKKLVRWAGLRRLRSSISPGRLISKAADKRWMWAVRDCIGMLSRPGCKVSTRACVCVCECV